MNDLNANTIQDEHIVKNSLTHLHPYEPPKWASSLKDIPQYFVKVSMILYLVYSFYFSFLTEVAISVCNTNSKVKITATNGATMNNAIG